MILKKIKIEDKYDYLKDVFLSLILVYFAFFINAGISIKGLYMDDLYMWSTRDGVSFFRYIFPGEMSKFRPVYWVVAWIYQGILGNNLKAIVPINILIGAGIAIGIYFFAKKLSGSKILSFILAIMFLTSRFSYYNIGQFLGLMEAMGIIFAAFMLYFLYRYINEDNNLYFIYACVMYFLNCFTHERFIVLFPMLIFAIIVKSGNRIKNTIISIASLFTIFGIRAVALNPFVRQFIKRLIRGKEVAGAVNNSPMDAITIFKSFVPEGTGGSNISDTFTLTTFFESLKSEVLYIFGINSGPEHLNGIKFSDVNLLIKCCIAVAILFLVLFNVKFIIAIIKNVKSFNMKWIINIVLFLGFIIGCIVSSGVTIRVEMRWLYAPYMFILLLIAYLYGIDKSCGMWMNKEVGGSLSSIFNISCLSITFIGIWAFLMMTADIYYRSFYDSIYLFHGQNRANSLAEESYYKYKGNLTDKKIYILENKFNLSEFDAREFFKTFDPEVGDDIVKFVTSYRDIGQIDDDMIVIAEDLKSNKYINVTSFLKNIKTESIYGHYDDGWTDEEALLNIMSGEKGKIQLEILYPGELTGNENIELNINGNTESLNLQSNITYYDIETTANTVIPVGLKSNFYMPDAKEQRGEKRLSFILNIKSE